MERIGERIKKVRKTIGISQDEFAQSLGVHRAHVSKVETGQSSPSPMFLKLVSEVFLVSYDWLKTGEGPCWISRMRIDIGNTMNEWLIFNHAISVLRQSVESMLNSTEKLLDVYVAHDLEDCPSVVIEDVRRFLLLRDHPVFPKLTAWSKRHRVGNKAHDQ